MGAAILAPLLLPLVPQTAPRPVDGTWVTLGSPPVTDAAVLCTTLAFDSEGVCHVAFQDDGASADRASVLRYEEQGGAGTWSFLGSRGGASIGRAWYDHVSFDAADRAYVVSRDYFAPGVAGVRVFDPALGDWADLGSGFSPFDAHYTHLAFDGAGVPYVVFTDGSTTPIDRARVARYVAGGWEVVGNGWASSGTAGYTSIAHVGGEPWIAFSDHDQGERVSVARLEPSTGLWEPVGTPGFTPGLSVNVRLSVSPAGEAHVAYHAWPNAVYVRRWNGAAWEPVGGPASAGDDAVVQTENWRQWLSLVFDDAGRPYVAYQDDEAAARLTVRRYDGGAWVVLGRPAFTPGRADYHALALDHRGTPHASFRSGPIGSGLEVTRFVEGVRTYCAPKASSTGALPRVGFEGVPSDTPPDDFAVTARSIPAGRVGLLLWSLEPDAKSQLGGTLCVKSPVKRAGLQKAGDAGTFRFPFSAPYRALHGIAPGTRVYGQWWFRDPGHPDGTGVGATGGLAFTARP